MRFAHLLARVTGTLWLITEDSLANITALLEARINGKLPTSAGLRDAPPAAIAAPAGVAVIPIFGIIGKRLSSMEMACGGCDVDAVGAAFDAANEDPRITSIAFHFDSPGGTVPGVPEMSAHITAYKKKPVMAISDTMIGSAAYWLAAAADEIVITPTAQVGAIGAALAVKEATGEATGEGSGKRIRVFRSGEHKLMGEDKPLTDVQASALQAQVDELGGMFRSFVSQQRPGIAPDTMQGLAYFGDAGVRLKLADRVVSSLAEAFS